MNNRPLVERRSIAKRKPIVLTLPYPISVNAMFGQAPGRQRFLTKEYADWRERATAALHRQKPGRLTGPVILTLTVEDRGRSDIDNLNKGVLDLLVKERVIEDDRRQIVRSVCTSWGSSGNDGVRVEITPV
jgi:Holliday junction resolvase RusA-like endonuclease